MFNNIDFSHGPKICRKKRTCVRAFDLPDKNKGRRRKMSDPDIKHATDVNQRSQPISIPAAAASPVVSPHIEGTELTFRSQFLNYGDIWDSIHPAVF